ncbi:MAG: IS21-like element helper ATPase IstB [Myxococcales bacterium]|nr:IS21-like element helper ATPase IstB [Myxococcales bacterium]
MLDEQTLEKMMDMKLSAMAEAFLELQKEAPGNQRSFGEKIGYMVDREWTARENRRLTRLLRAAKLNSDACMEDVWTTAGRGVDKATIRTLSTCRWIENHHNVICIGKTGCGKSYLAAALAQAACRRGFQTLYSRVPRLVQELAVARADGSYTKVLARLAKLRVLVLDDFLIAPLKDVERRDLLEILEDRYGHSSTILTSQLPTAKWHAALGDPTVADAICDRVVHNAHVLNLQGPSGRQRKGLSTKS